MAEEKPITIKVYGQEFNLRVADQDKEVLEKAAKLVDMRMKEIASSGVINLHRVAMLAAIDITFQTLLEMPGVIDPDKKGARTNSDSKKESTKIQHLIDKIDKSLKKTGDS